MIDINSPNLSDYERTIIEFRGDGRFRSNEEMLACCALGLSEESSELMCAVDNNCISDILTEAGDVVWYATTAAHRLGFTLSQIRSIETATGIITSWGTDDEMRAMARYAGAFSGLVKKQLFHEKPMNREWAARYLAEILDCAKIALEHEGRTFEDALEANIAKLRKRFSSGGFTAAEANARADEAKASR